MNDVHRKPKQLTDNALSYEGKEVEPSTSNDTYLYIESRVDPGRIYEDIVEYTRDEFWLGLPTAYRDLDTIKLTLGLA